MPHTVECVSLTSNANNPFIRHFLETVIGSAVHWLIEVKILHLVLVLVGFGCHMWVKNWVQYIPAKLFYTSLVPRLISSYQRTGKKEPGYEANFTHGSSNVPLLIVIWNYSSCRMSGSCTGQSEVWMQSVVPQYDQPCTC